MNITNLKSISIDEGAIFSNNKAKKPVYIVIDETKFDTNYGMSPTIDFVIKQSDYNNAIKTKFYTEAKPIFTNVINNYDIGFEGILDIEEQPANLIPLLPELPTIPIAILPEMPVNPTPTLPQMPIIPKPILPEMPVTPTPILPELPIIPTPILPEMPIIPTPISPESPTNPQEIDEDIQNQPENMTTQTVIPNYQSLVQQVIPIISNDTTYNVAQNPDNPDEYFVYDIEGTPLGAVIVPKGEKIEDINIDDNLIPLSYTKVNKENKTNPKTQDMSNYKLSFGTTGFLLSIIYIVKKRKSIKN